MKSRHVLISASAGSGKTYKLVHHFLGILHDGLLARDQDRQPRVVERILAATFTRAAAGEIIDRILERVAKAMLDPDERLALCRELGLDGLCEDDCGTLLAALVAKLHRLRVCTLDSFLVRSAQAFSTELGLLDAWAIMDDSADLAACLEAVDQVLTERAADPAQFAATVKLLVMLNQGRYPLQVRSRLVEHLRACHFASSVGPGEAWEKIGPRAGHGSARDPLAKLVTALPASALRFIPSTQKGTPDGRWVSALEKVASNALQGNHDGLLGSGLTSLLADAAPTYFKKPLHPDLIRLLQPFRDHAGAGVLELLRDRNFSTRELLAAFDREYRRVKSRRSAYRFDDFTNMLLEADVTENLADFYYRLDGQIDHILLDEFQDTSIPQWRLIRPLVDEIMAGEGAGGGKRSFFCVGDVKQTLYGWRSAEPELLAELTRNWPDLQQEHLILSQRSSPVIIDTVNRIFGNIARNPALVPDDDSQEYLTLAAEDWAGWFKEHGTARVNVPGFCRLVTCSEGECASDRHDAATHLAAKRAAELHGANPGAEIAILVRRRMFIPWLLASLRRLGVAASGEGGSPLADDMAVCTVLSLLHLIEHPSDTAAVFHVGTSPLGPCVGLGEKSSPKQVVDKTSALRAEILDRGLGATINGWMALCAASCDARNFRRLRQLVELALAYDYDGGDLGPFIETVRASGVEDAEASKIRVMTIHASKGRQFDYVILPDLDRNFISAGPVVLFDRPALLAEADCITTRPTAAQAAVDERLAKMDCAWRRRQVVEELCALYVALTRAKSGMEMIIHPCEDRNGEPKFPRTAAGVLRGALADAAPPGNTLWTHPASVFPAGELAPASPAGQTPQPISLRVTPPRAASRLRPIIAPSGLEGSGTINLRHTLTLSDNDGADRGTVLHRWFQMIEWLDHPLPGDRQLCEAAALLKLSFSATQIDELLGTFRRACKAPKLNRLLSEASYRSAAPAGAQLEVWRERAFAVPMQLPDSGAHVVVRGQLDRVVLVRSAGKVIAAEIVDFKSDHLEHESATEKAQFYTPQIRAYRAAISQLTDLADSAVTAKLVFLATDEIVSV